MTTAYGQIDTQPTGPGRYHSPLSHLLRAVGLEIFNVFARKRPSTGSVEPIKQIITSSRWLALARCAVHLLPAAFSVVLLVLNLKHYYIGTHLQGIITDDSTDLALLQVGAKA